MGLYGVPMSPPERGKSIILSCSLSPAAVACSDHPIRVGDRAAPRWFWRFMYDRESASWERRRDEPENRELVERTADEFCAFVAPPGPVVDLGCGPGAHTRALARRGYHVTGLDNSPRMVDVARHRATRDNLNVAYEVADVGTRLPFADGSLGGVLAILVIQHLSDPASFVGEVRRCLRPGGHLLLTAPDRKIAPLTTG